MGIYVHKYVWYIFVWMYLCKGPSKNVNIFMSVQTVHFFRPPPPSPPSVQTNILSFQIMGFTQSFIVQQQKLTLILRLFDM